MTPKDFPQNNPGLLLQRLINSDAAKIHARLEALNNNFYVFGANYRELRDAIRLPQEPDTLMEMWSREKVPEMLSTLREIMRLLHNFVAAAKALVEHTRIVIRKWYVGTEFLEKYNTEVKVRFADNDVTQFIEELRNYTLHYALPLTNATLHIDRNPDTNEFNAEHAFTLNKDVLLYWNGWTKSYEFIKSAPEGIKIEPLITTYYEEVKSFHEWVRQSLTQIHQKELNWFLEMRKKIGAM